MTSWSRLKRWLGVEAEEAGASEWRTVYEGTPNDVAELVDVLAEAGIPTRTASYLPEVWQGRGPEPRRVMVAVRRFQEGRASDVIASRPDLDPAERARRLGRRGGRSVAEFASAEDVEKAMTALRAAGIDTAIVQEPLHHEAGEMGYVISVPQRDLYDAAEMIKQLVQSDESGTFQPRDLAQVARPRFEPSKPRHHLPPAPPRAE